MKPFKLILFCVIVTIVTAVSWAIGGVIGNVITSSEPPPPADAASAGSIFLGVCAINSLLIAVLFWATQNYTGTVKRITMIIYVFALQFLLTQLETYFFASGIGITIRQTTGILISGAISSLITMLTATVLFDKFSKQEPAEPFVLSIHPDKKTLLILLLLIVIGYPSLYLTFGYYVAWQSESLRLFYTSSSALDPFIPQTLKAFSNGIYLFQIIRGLIWVIVTTPIVILLQGNPIRQYLVVAFISALLPTCLLFIPNPYMPADISFTHFIETSSSNFLWGLMMVWGIKTGLKV